MMWNQNDTKYIIKRLILYALISCIVFFGAQSCAKAQVMTTDFSPIANPNIVNISGGGTTSINFTKTIFQNAGQGYVNFSLFEVPGTSNTIEPIYSISVGNSNSIFQCQFETQIWYINNHEQINIFNVNCPVNPGSSGLTYMLVEKGGLGDVYLKSSTYITYISEQSDANQIINAQSTATQQQINELQSQGNATRQQLVEIESVIETTTQQQITAINAQTSAINAQTQWQQQDFQYDSSWADSLNLFGNDTNYIRQLLMWPFTFSLVIGQSLGGNSCNAYTFGSLYGTQITLPCINWKNYVGNTIYTTIDTIMGIVILFGVITYIRKVFEYVFSFGAKAYETVDVEVFK